MILEAIRTFCFSLAERHCIAFCFVDMHFLGEIAMDFYSLIPVENVRVETSQFQISLLGQDQQQLDFLFHSSHGLAQISTSIGERSVRCLMAFTFSLEC